ncbi:bifunctional metallophosphatase/5'-nucleotidase [Dactylosporangium sp. CA-092794]|uniref:bifunctional metallophosphatase/5'-nucleotidase n=1 Tax=Dactylosporangium sp. CA-092794 TaxID=3239929 RepID=UPI003D9501C8
MNWQRAGAAALVAGAVLCTSVVGVTPAGAAPTTGTIEILGINDFHGRLESPGNDPDGKPIGGAAQLAGMIAAVRQANPDTLVVSAGDNIGASPFVSAVQQDKPTIEFLNAIGLTVSAVGNHEFDRGFADLTGRVDGLAGFPYLGANVYRGGAPALPESYIAHVGGIDVGFVGVVTQQTASLVTPTGIAGLEFRDPVAEANRVAKRLHDSGAADLVVLLVHEGADASGSDAAACAAVADPATVFGKIVRGANAGIDAIVSGHTHMAYSCSYPVPGLGHDRPVLQTGSYGSALDRITVTVTGGAVTGVTGKLMPAVGQPTDPAVAALVADAKRQADEVGKEKIGTITADIKRAYNPDNSDNRGGESVMGNFIADVQLDQTRDANRGGAQIALMNPGGLRADFLKGADGGVITYAEAATVQPFANDIITQTLTGAQIKTALEEQWQPAGASRPFLHLGVSKGFSYVYDPAGPPGERVPAGGITLNGQVLSPTGKYRVTTNSFLAAGGDNFTALGQGTDRFATGDNDLTVLVNYFRTRSPVTADTAQRAFTVAERPPGGSASPVPPPAGGGELPVTGDRIGVAVAVGVLLLGAGTTLVLVARRRRIRYVSQ